MLLSIIYSTLGQLATGILVFIALVPPSKIGKGFGRFHAGLALALWILAVHGRFNTPFFILSALLILTILFAWSDRWYYPFLISSIAVSFFVLISADSAMLGTTAALVAHIPPVLVLGASSVAMLLGHWYLVSPNLSITYLKMLTIGLILAILVRSGLLVEAMIGAGSRLDSLRFFELYGMFFIQRVVLGLLLTLILSILTYFCVKIRSTQSATGILYVVLVFCLIGEVIGSYLFEKTGILF